MNWVLIRKMLDRFAVIKNHRSKEKLVLLGKMHKDLIIEGCSIARSALMTAEYLFYEGGLHALMIVEDIPANAGYYEKSHQTKNRYPDVVHAMINVYIFIYELRRIKTSSRLGIYELNFNYTRPNNIII